MINLKWVNIPTLKSYVYKDNELIYSGDDTYYNDADVIDNVKYTYNLVYVDNNVLECENKCSYNIPNIGLNLGNSPLYKTIGNDSSRFTTNNGQIKTNSLYDFDKDFTLEFEVMIDIQNSLKTTARVFAFGIWSPSTIEMEVYNGNLRLYINGIGYSTYNISDYTISSNTWYHICITRESKKFTIFVDGKLITSSVLDNIEKINDERPIYFSTSPEGHEYSSLYLRNFRFTYNVLYTENYTTERSYKQLKESYGFDDLKNYNNSYFINFNKECVQLNNESITLILDNLIGYNDFCIDIDWNCFNNNGSILKFDKLLITKGSNNNFDLYFNGAFIKSYTLNESVKIIRKNKKLIIDNQSYIYNSYITEKNVIIENVNGIISYPKITFGHYGCVHKEEITKCYDNPNYVFNSLLDKDITVSGKCYIVNGNGVLLYNNGNISMNRRYSLDKGFKLNLDVTPLSDGIIAAINYIYVGFDAGLIIKKLDNKIYLIFSRAEGNNKYLSISDYVDIPNDIIHNIKFNIDNSSYSLMINNSIYVAKQVGTSFLTESRQILQFGKGIDDNTTKYCDMIIRSYTFESDSNKSQCVFNNEEEEQNYKLDNVYTKLNDYNYIKLSSDTNCRITYNNLIENNDFNISFEFVVTNINQSNKVLLDADNIMIKISSNEYLIYVNDTLIKNINFNFEKPVEINLYRIKDSLYINGEYLIKYSDSINNYLYIGSSKSFTNSLDCLIGNFNISIIKILDVFFPYSEVFSVEFKNGLQYKSDLKDQLKLYGSTNYANIVESNFTGGTYSLYCTGNTDTFYYNETPISIDTNFIIEMDIYWTNMSDTGYNQIFFELVSESKGRMFSLCNWSKLLWVRSYTSGSVDSGRDSSIKWTDNTLYHVKLINDSSSCKLYINDSIYNINTSWSVLNDVTVRIGPKSQTDWNAEKTFYIDNVKIKNITSYKHIKLYITSNCGADSNKIAIQEIDMFDHNNLSIVKFINDTDQSSFYKGVFDANAKLMINGNTSDVGNVWETDNASNFPHWATFSFDRSISLSKIRIYPQNGTQFVNRSPKDFVIYVSNDTENWTKIKNINNVTEWAAGSYIDFDIN